MVFIIRVILILIQTSCIVILNRLHTNYSMINFHDVMNNRIRKNYLISRMYIFNNNCLFTRQYYYKVDLYTSKVVMEKNNCMTFSDTTMTTDILRE